MTELHLPYRNEIDLTTLVKEEIHKAIKELGLRNDADLTVKVEIEYDLVLVISIGPSNSVVLQ